MDKSTWCSCSGKCRDLILPAATICSPRAILQEDTDQCNPEDWLMNEGNPAPFVEQAADPCNNCQQIQTPTNAFSKRMTNYIKMRRADDKSYTTALMLCHCTAQQDADRRQNQSGVSDPTGLNSSSSSADADLISASKSAGRRIEIGERKEKLSYRDSSQDLTFTD